MMYSFEINRDYANRSRDSELRSDHLRRNYRKAAGQVRADRRTGTDRLTEGQ